MWWDHLPYPFSDSEDAGHLFFALPGFIYATAVYIDCTNALPFKIVRSWMEPLALFLVGVGVFLGEGGALLNCSPRKPHYHSCIDKNQMHVIFGVILMEFGVLSALFRTKIMVGKYDFVAPAMLVVVGVFMTMHAQDSEYGDFMHQAYGISSVASGIALGLARVWDALMPLAASLVMLTSGVLIFSSYSTERYFDKHYGYKNTAFLVVSLVYGYFTGLTALLWCIGLYRRRRQLQSELVHGDDDVDDGGVCVAMKPLSCDEPDGIDAVDTSAVADEPDDAVGPVDVAA